MYVLLYAFLAPNSLCQLLWCAIYERRWEKELESANSFESGIFADEPFIQIEGTSNILIWKVQKYWLAAYFSTILQGARGIAARTCCAHVIFQEPSMFKLALKNGATFLIHLNTLNLTKTTAVVFQAVYQLYQLENWKSQAVNRFSMGFLVFYLLTLTTPVSPGPILGPEAGRCTGAREYGWGAPRLHEMFLCEKKAKGGNLSLSQKTPRKFFFFFNLEHATKRIVGYCRELVVFFGRRLCMIYIYIYCSLIWIVV